jgi:DNA polymerase III epsilon subunit-like protein
MPLNSAETTDQKILVTDSLSSSEGADTLADVELGKPRTQSSACYAFVDCETTGFDPLRNCVLTLACYVTDSEYNLIGEHYGEFRPDGSKEICWGDEAEKVHGISWEQSQSFPDMGEASESFLAFLEKHPPLTFIAHNMAFDRRMVRGTLSKTDRHFRFYQCFPRFQDTIKIVKESGLTNGKSRSLGVICKELGIEHDHHDARSDAKVLIQIHKLATQKLSKETILALSEAETAS